MKPLIKDQKNILIVGVGGQGVLLASEMLAAAAAQAGYDVKQSEVHGMAQRGGVVSSHVRIGPSVQSPLIPAGQADILLCFEQAEALRWVHFCRPGGTVIVNLQKLVPPIALMKGHSYPEDPLAGVRRRAARVIPVDAAKIAASLENSRVVNVVLLGAVSRHLDIPPAVWEKVIEKRVPPGTAPVNNQAFKKGRSASSL
ncbi:indolepyruvate oxidoreductase subunit beta [bacterium]|nr:indolepyruvate oxidoreductase subunit beta [bacterium]